MTDVCLHCEAPIGDATSWVSVGDSAVHADCASELPDTLVNRPEVAASVLDKQIGLFDQRIGEETADIAHDILAAVIGSEYGRNKRVQAIAAAALYAAVVVKGRIINQDSISRATGVSAVSIRTHHRHALDIWSGGADESIGAAVDTNDGNPR